MINTKKLQKGVTLIELVIYMGILSIILIIFIQMFALLVDKQLETESVSRVQQDGNFLLLKLSNDFQSADSIISPSSPGQTTTNLVLLTNTIPTQYLIENSNLVASSSGIKTQLNGFDTTVSDISFQRLGSGNEKDVVRIAFNLKSRVKKQSEYETYQFLTTLGTREK